MKITFHLCVISAYLNQRKIIGLIIISQETIVMNKKWWHRSQSHDQTVSVPLVLQTWRVAWPQLLQLLRVWRNFQQPVTRLLIPAFTHTPWLSPTSLKQQSDKHHSIAHNLRPVPLLQSLGKTFVSPPGEWSVHKLETEVWQEPGQNEPIGVHIVLKEEYGRHSAEKNEQQPEEWR